MELHLIKYHIWDDAVYPLNKYDLLRQVPADCVRGCVKHVDDVIEEQVLLFCYNQMSEEILRPEAEDAKQNG